jgi:hypothetical protein
MFKLADNGYTDIIIYLVILVGGLIANAYKNYTKKKEPEKSTDIPRPTQRPIFPDVLFEPVFEYNEPDVEQEKYPVEDIPILDSQKSAIDIVPEETVPVKTYIEGEAVFQETKEIMLTDHFHENSSIETEDLTTAKFFEKEERENKEAFEFDVAQAVIYSEILKPKYI